MLTVLIPFYNGHKYLEPLLQGVPANIPVLVVNDKSEEGISLTNEYPNVKIVDIPDKGYFTGAVNYGLAMIDPERDVLVLNQDSLLDWEKIERLLAYHHDADLLGERVRGVNTAWPQGYIHGTFMLIRATARKAVPYMDARNFPLWGSTAAYQLAVSRAGLTVRPLPHVDGYTHLREGRKGSSIKSLFPDGKESRKFFAVPPVISVVVNLYNQGRYLPDLFASLFGGYVAGIGYMAPQTFQAFEVIVVDDGSTDNSLDIARQYASDFTAVRVFTKKNGGSASAMNYGVSQANGRYIAPLDSDDMMLSHRLQTLYDEAEQYGGQMVVCDALVRYNEGQKFVDSQGRFNDVQFMAPHDLTELLIRNRMHKGIFYTKDAWKRTGGYPEVMTKGREDWAFNVALAASGYCGHIVNAPMYVYRRGVHNRTLTNTNPVARAEFATQVRDLFPMLYEEDISTMACCGSKKPTKQPKITVQDINLMASRTVVKGEALVLLEYLGRSSPVTWQSPITGTSYVFGNDKAYKFRYVKESDVTHFLNIWEDEKRQFKVAQSPTAEPSPVLEPTTLKAPASTPAPSPKLVIELSELTKMVDASQTYPTNDVGNSVGYSAEDVGYDYEEEEGEVVEVDVPDLTQLAVAAIATHLATHEYTLDELYALLELEQQAKNRTTAVTMFNAHIAAAEREAENG